MARARLRVLAWFGVAATPLACSDGEFGRLHQPAAEVDVAGLANDTGLLAEYYDNADFTALKVQRTDPRVNFNWGSGAPAQGVGGDTFSVRWTGEVQAPTSESYTFYTTSDDGVRLYVDGKLVVDNWTNHAPIENRSAPIALVTGRRYPIKMEFYENGGGAVAQLRWSAPSVAKQIVPQSRLFVPSGAPAPTTNLALGKPARASSVEGADLDAEGAFDGNGATRWSSAFGDPQWIEVDLGASASISRIKLNWENAYGREYALQVSSDAVSWTTIAATTTSDGGVDDVTGLSATGRYVRMLGTQRATMWGYSLWEFEVYGNGGGTAPAPDAGTSPPIDSGPPPPSKSKPDATNTGVPAGTPLTIVAGDRTFATDGEVVMNTDFRGFVDVTASNVRFKNCIFRGSVATFNTPLFNSANAMNTVVEDSEFVAASPSPWIDCINAKNTSIYRANIHGCVDGGKLYGNVLVQDSYVHDMTWFASDPNQGGGATHNDGFQAWPLAQNITLRHNNIDMATTQGANAALQSSATNVHIEDNWLDGGGCTLNFAHNATSGPLSGIHVVNNRFGRNSFFQCPILLSTQTTLTENSGNVWVDTGAPIPPPQQHD